MLNDIWRSRPPLVKQPALAWLGSLHFFYESTGRGELRVRQADLLIHFPDAIGQRPALLFRCQQRARAEVKRRKKYGNKKDCRYSINHCSSQHFGISTSYKISSIWIQHFQKFFLWNIFQKLLQEAFLKSRRFFMIFHHAKDRSTIRKAVLLINFGTPSSPSKKSVRDFLLDLFHDQPLRLPPLIKQLVVRACIIPWHINRAVSRYRAIWTEEGSPLLAFSRKCAEGLSELLPDDTAVAIAMHYGQPSIDRALAELQNIDQIVVLPLFPQKAPSLTNSILASVSRCLLQRPSFPHTTYISSFFRKHWYIESCAKRLKDACPGSFDHVVFSFHAIPKGRSNEYCQQCLITAQMIAKRASVDPSRFSVSFQSKAGLFRWTSPSTRQVLDSLLKRGKKRVLVMCPSFMVDCVETLGEIAGEYRADFLGKGGEALGLVESLNDFPPFIEGLAAHFKGVFR
jgi:protoporphyrin/coproporphyrin ferrochelatase